MSRDHSIKIDADFPGGNIIVEDISGDIVRLRHDLRDTEGHWFYWCFRVRGAAGRTLSFQMPTEVNVIGVRGPAVSLDGMRTWRWLGAEAVTPERQWSFAFPPDANEAYFGVGMTYVQASLERFLSRIGETPHLELGELCRTRKGRTAERLRSGCLCGQPRYRLAVTCRHHACEMMAGYVLEGLIEQVLADDATGAWLRENVEIFAVPFMDKDGVEDGDQGKNRRPHDHARDYAGEPIYPTVAANKSQVSSWVGDTPTFAFDLHCPYLRGAWHEVLMSPSRRAAETWNKARPFLKILDQTQSGPLRFVLAESDRFEGWGGSPPRPPRPANAPSPTFSGWIKTLPKTCWALTFEMPYANSRGAEVNQDTARTWGRDLAMAFQQYLVGLDEGR